LWGIFGRADRLDRDLIVLVVTIRTISFWSFRGRFGRATTTVVIVIVLVVWSWSFDIPAL
jgi:hypothetical protein